MTHPNSGGDMQSVRVVSFSTHGWGNGERTGERPRWMVDMVVS
jgi:hypothetical protein